MYDMSVLLQNTDTYTSCMMSPSKLCLISTSEAPSHKQSLKPLSLELNAYCVMMIAHEKQTKNVLRRDGSEPPPATQFNSLNLHC